MTDHYHEANRRRWDAGSSSWADQTDTRGTWRESHRDPSLAQHPAELELLSDIAGKRVAVLGSGDNQVVFALSGLGAEVTSVDISEEQLNVARDRAAALGLAVSFVWTDVTDLSSLRDQTYDIVYTGGHVAVWVSDLQRYYQEATRVLKPHGLLVVSEYHPFRRVWKDAPRLEIGYDYFNRGPYRFEFEQDASHGELEQFEFHWTVADYVSAVLSSGCQLVHIEEFGLAKEDWEGAPLADLPATLLLVGRRNGQGG